jgi:hypothetical protein
MLRQSRLAHFGALVLPFVGVIALINACSSSSNPGEEEDSGTDATDRDVGVDAAHESGTTPDATTDGGVSDAAADVSTPDEGPDTSTPTDAEGDSGKKTDAAEDSATTDAAHDASTADAAEDTTTVDAAHDASTADVAEDTTTVDAAHDASTADVIEDTATGDSAGDTGTQDSGCGGATPVALTVYNYKAWCNVSVAGASIPTPALGTTEAQTMCVASGVDLSAEPVSANFELGTPPLPFLFGANAVTDAAGKASTTLATGAKCVFICCPFAAGGGCTGLTNPCP